jgi:DNA polymerase
MRSRNISERNARDFIPERPTLPLLKTAIHDCLGCDLYLNATQAVFGEGPATASILLVGEQPGDQEDQIGRPFVGPAGRVLDRALGDAGIDRTSVYVTNAVKHFKFEERGKRRIHKKPSQSEVKACRPWLEAESAIIQPVVIVCLGATAAHSVFGPEYRLTRERGRLVTHSWARWATSTIHPSAILRGSDQAQRHVEYEKLVTDLTVARRASEAAAPKSRTLA